MLKNIFKSAKKLLKSPIGQFGIGLLAPQLSFLKGVSPALIQGGIGLLSGAKPEDVLKGIALGAGQAALTGKGGISNFLMGDSAAPATGSYKGSGEFKEAMGGVGNIVDDVVDAATKIGGSLFFDKEGNFNTELASLLVGLYGASQDPSLQDVDPRPFTNITDMTDDYRKSLEESRFQNTGGIAGYLKGGEKLTSIGINSLTGEPSGLVTGPGTGKSDSIRFVSSEAKVPTDISNGEFIITKEATDKIGPENLYALQTAFDKDAETFEEGQERMAMV